MKLVVTGATGLVGTEVIRQALANPAITSIVAITRKPLDPPSTSTTTTNPPTPHKLTIHILPDFTDWSAPATRTALAHADAIIWTLAITPTKAKTQDPALVRRVCYDYTLSGLAAARAAQDPDARHALRFIYVSGAATERDQSAAPHPLLGEYAKMRGAVENALHDAASASASASASEGGKLEVTVAKPGMIDGPGRGMIVSAGLRAAGGLGVLPVVQVGEVAAALLGVAVGGGGPAEMLNEELVGRGRAGLKAAEAAR